MSNVHTFPACRNNLCNQGRAMCPTPQACQVADHEDGPTLAASTRNTAPLPWLTPRRFWIGYVLGVASGVVGLHLWARF